MVNRGQTTTREMEVMHAKSKRLEEVDHTCKGEKRMVNLKNHLHDHTTTQYLDDIIPYTSC